MVNYKDVKKSNKRTTRNIILIVCGIIGLSIIIALITYFAFFANNEDADTNAPGDLDNSEQTNEQQENGVDYQPPEETNDELNEEGQNEPNEDEQNESESESPQAAILDQVVPQIERLHDFSSPNETLYSDVVNELSDNNVAFELSESDQNIFTYGLNEESGEILVVTASIYTDTRVLETEDGFIIEIDARSANSPTENDEGEIMDANTVGENLQAHLNQPEHSDLNETFIYQLTGSDEDGWALSRE